VKLNEHIQHVGMYFLHGTMQHRAVAKDKLPEQIRNVFSLEGDNINVTGLYADSQNQLVREAAYKIFLYPDPHQESLLQELLTSRLTLSDLCGFPSYSQRVLRGSLAGSPDKVMSFLDLLNHQLRDRADSEFAQMLEVKRRTGATAQVLKPWDVPYMSKLVKQERYNVNISDLMPYFSIGACMEGLNLLTNRLFDISLTSEGVEHGETWSPDVHKLAVVHKTEGLLGYIYCDLFERPGKPTQDSHFTIVGGRQLSDGSYQLPVVALMLNFPPPTWTTPTLLTPGMVDNLFHEFGHALHSMLARTRHQHVTGTRCSTDFAEVPSILMEYFAADERVVSKFARHYKSGEALPTQLLHSYCRSNHSFTAAETQLQLFYSALDQRYHSAQPYTSSTSDVISQVQNTYYGLPHEPNTAWQLRFGHLVGYGAKYYAYLISKAVAASIWQRCFLDDPFNRSWAEKYRRDLLGHGGGKPAKQLVEGFLETEVTADLLVKSLINEIDDNTHR